MGQCVWAEPGRIGSILTGHDRRGNSTWKKVVKEGRTPAASLESNPPLQSLTSCPHNHNSVSTVSLHHH